MRIIQAREPDITVQSYSKSRGKANFFVNKCFCWNKMPLKEEKDSGALSCKGGSAPPSVIGEAVGRGYVMLARQRLSFQMCCSIQTRALMKASIQGVTSSLRRLSG